MAYSDLTLKEKREVLMQFDNHGGNYTKAICGTVACCRCPFVYDTCLNKKDRKICYEKSQSMLAKVNAEIEKQSARNAQSEVKDG